MQSKNKKNQNLIGIDKIALPFYPNKGIGKLKFSFQEDEIIQILGTASKKEKIEYDKISYAIMLGYFSIGISAYIHYENNLFVYTSYNVDDLLIKNIKLSSLKKDQIIELIKEYHNNFNYSYSCEYSYDSSVNEEEYFYENLGLTIWFEEEEISDICISNIID